MHANTAVDALRRLESMIMRTGLDAPRHMIQEDIASTIDFVIQSERSHDGRRRVVEITEILGRNETGYQSKTIFKYTPGQGFQATGEVPDFVVNPKSIKAQFPPNFFKPEFKIKLTG